MGVSGSGKSYIGSLMAQRIEGCFFLEGDSLHPPANIRKMESGIPLQDEDRWGWLDLLGREMAGMQSRGSCIASCSALKRAYRDRLRSLVPGLRFFYLLGDKEIILRRMEQREHFMPVSLLDSQFQTLEEPRQEEEDVLTCSIEKSPSAILDFWAEAWD